METFKSGETIICSITVRDEDGALQDAVTSMKIIIKLNGAEIVAATGMENDGTGLYHYDYDSDGAGYGDYNVIYTAIDGTRVSIETDTFRLLP